MFALLALAAAATRPAADKPVDLKADAERIAAAELKRFGAGYVSRIDHQRHIVYISALDAKHFRQTDKLLTEFYDAYLKTAGGTRLRWNLTILLPTAEDYRELTAGRRAAGFYRPADRKLVSIDRRYVLLHEFTHALHHADMAAARQLHPIWVREGIATLLESSRPGPTGLSAVLDSRITSLQDAIRSGKALPLRRLMAMTDKQFHARRKLCYAQSRYVMFYLHKRGLLAQWYAACKGTFAKDRTGAAATEKVLGKPLEAVEREWKAWVMKLRWPWGKRRFVTADLGLRMRPAAGGVKVVAIVRGSPAERAGRVKVGDIIVEFNGRKVRTYADIIEAIRAAGPMQTVTIKLIRDGREITVRQPLGAARVR